MQNQFSIFPIADSALTIDFGNHFDDELHQYISFLTEYFRENAIEGIREIVPAYTSISIFYNILKIKKTEKTAFEIIKNWCEETINFTKNQELKTKNSKLITIPVIYDGEDLAFVAENNNLSIEEVIKIHTAPTYRVYMIGFLPGFAYMGGMDERIATPRRSSPRTSVPAGSVGIAGKQTGIYPLESPGGWQLIGRTTIPLFTPHEVSPTLLKAGDLVRFEAIHSQ